MEQSSWGAPEGPKKGSLVLCDSQSSSILSGKQRIVSVFLLGRQRELRPRKTRHLLWTTWPEAAEMESSPGPSKGTLWGQPLPGPWPLQADKSQGSPGALALVFHVMGHMGRSGRSHAASIRVLQCLETQSSAHHRRGAHTL